MITWKTEWPYVVFVWTCRVVIALALLGGLLAALAVGTALAQDGLIGIPQRIKVLFVAIRSGSVLTLEDAALNDLVKINDAGNPDVRIELAGNGVIENDSDGDNEISLNASSVDIKSANAKPVIFYNNGVEVGRITGTAWTHGDAGNTATWTYATDTLALSNSATIDFGNDDGVINGIATLDRGSASSIGIGNEATDTAAVAGLLTVGASATIGGGDAVVRIKKYSGTIDLPSIAANTCNTGSSIAAAGVASNDACTCTTDLFSSAVINACDGQTNTIVWQACNNSAGAVDPGSATFTATCIEF